MGSIDKKLKFLNLVGRSLKVMKDTIQKTLLQPFGSLSPLDPPHLRKLFLITDSNTVRKLN